MQISFYWLQDQSLLVIHQYDENSLVLPILPLRYQGEDSYLIETNSIKEGYFFSTVGGKYFGAYQSSEYPHAVYCVRCSCSFAEIARIARDIARSNEQRGANLSVITTVCDDRQALFAKMCNAVEQMPWKITASADILFTNYLKRVDEATSADQSATPARQESESPLLDALAAAAAAAASTSLPSSSNPPPALHQSPALVPQGSSASQAPSRSFPTQPLLQQRGPSTEPALAPQSTHSYARCQLVYQIAFFSPSQFPLGAPPASPLVPTYTRSGTGFAAVLPTPPDPLHYITEGAWQMRRAQVEQRIATNHLQRGAAQRGECDYPEALPLPEAFLTETELEKFRLEEAYWKDRKDACYPPEQPSLPSTIPGEAAAARPRVSTKARNSKRMRNRMIQHSAQGSGAPNHGMPLGQPSGGLNYGVSSSPSIVQWGSFPPPPPPPPLAPQLSPAALWSLVHGATVSSAMTVPSSYMMMPPPQSIPQQAAAAGGGGRSHQGGQLPLALSSLPALFTSPIGQHTGQSSLQSPVITTPATQTESGPVQSGTEGVQLPQFQPQS